MHYLPASALLKKEWSWKTNIYSLGIFIYEMFEGKQYFPTLSRAELIVKQRSNNYPEITTNPFANDLYKLCIQVDGNCIENHNWETNICKNFLEFDKFVSFAQVV